MSEKKRSAFPKEFKLEAVRIVLQNGSAGVQSFYLSVGYDGGVHPGDRLMVAHVDQSIIAAVRLCAEGSTLVLRGMYVAEESRGLGIGSRLLESASGLIGKSECWCLPYAHLTSFYSRIGFHVCEGKTIPPFLAARWERYTTGGKKVVVMKRSKL